MPGTEKSKAEAHSAQSFTGVPSRHTGTHPPIVGLALPGRQGKHAGQTLLAGYCPTCLDEGAAVSAGDDCPHPTPAARNAKQALAINALISFTRWPVAHLTLRGPSSGITSLRNTLNCYRAKWGPGGGSHCLVQEPDTHKQGEQEALCCLCASSRVASR